MENEDLVKQYKEAGVDLPELDAEPKEPEKEPEEEPKPEPQPEKGVPEKAEEEPLQETKEQRKRSIYDEYKEKKAELKSEKEMREQAERERDELRQRLEDFSQAKTPEERQDAQDELEKFAQETGADPQALRRMRELFLKDVKPQTDEGLARDLQEFKAWKEQNSHVIEKSLFNEEFTKITPQLKEMFPTANDAELDAIKDELDKVSHTQEYHDKELDYVAFKHRQKLESLVSPKKRGIESRGRVDAQEDSFEFDPNADYAKMSPKQREQWEKEYAKLTKSEGLTTDAEGKKIFM